MSGMPDVAYQNFSMLLIAADYIAKNPNAVITKTVREGAISDDSSTVQPRRNASEFYSTAAGSSSGPKNFSIKARRKAALHFKVLKPYLERSDFDLLCKKIFGIGKYIRGEKGAISTKAKLDAFLIKFPLTSELLKAFYAANFEGNHQEFLELSINYFKRTSSLKVIHSQQQKKKREREEKKKGVYKKNKG